MQTRRLAPFVALALTAIVATSASAQHRGRGPARGGGNAEQLPMTFSNWADASKTCGEAKNAFDSAKKAADDATRKYDDASASGGRDADLGGKLADLRRTKDDKQREENSRKVYYRRCAQGADTFVAGEEKNAKTDADKKSAALHRADVNRWKQASGA